jgi:hypothetical protein
MTIDLPNLTPDVYRRNAFRILGVPTSTSFRAITKREQRLNTAIEMTDNDAIRDLTIGNLMGLPDEPLVRLSSNRLGDPHQRLVDELFWLRTSEDEESTFQRLRERQPESIIDLLTQWEIIEESGEGDDALRATHNLAVFHHMLAIEIEIQIDRHLKSTDYHAASLQALKRLADYSWQISLPRWRAVLETEQTWTWLHERAIKIDKRRLKPGDVESIRQDAHSALLVIMAQFMARHANAGQAAEVDRIQAIVRKSGFDDASLDRARQNAVAPDIADMDNRITAFSDRLKTDKTGLKQATSQLLDAIEPKIKALRLLLNKRDAKLTALENSFATAANNGQIAHWNKEKDDDFSLVVLNRIRPYAHSTQLLTRIDVDIENTQCMFCKKNAKRLSSSCSVNMYRIVDVQPVLSRYTLRTQTISVPRCDACARKGLTRGVEQHQLVKGERDAGWKIGREPSQEDLRAAFRAVPLSDIDNPLGRLR